MSVWMLAMSLASAQGGGVANEFPCQDGFRTCQVNGETVQPGLRQDGTGMPMDAGSRMGWFDLQPSSVFSPFVAVQRLGQAEVAPVPIPKPTKIVRSKTKTRKVETKVETKTTTTVRTKAKVIVPPKKDVPVVQPKVIPPPPETVETLSCDVATLEGSALTGGLAAEDQACLLQTRDADATSMTQRSAISRVLMVDAFAKNDRATHDTLLAHHLEHIDQSDPDLCLRQALVMSRKGSPMSAIRWADVALENRAVWTGSSYVRKVSSTYKLRAAMAQARWQALGKEEALPSAEQNQKIDAARALTKTLAREWLDYTRSADLDANAALELCLSASGSKAFCR